MSSYCSLKLFHSIHSIQGTAKQKRFQNSSNIYDRVAISLLEFPRQEQHVWNFAVKIVARNNFLKCYNISKCDSLT